MPDQPADHAANLGPAAGATGTPDESGVVDVVVLAGGATAATGPIAFVGLASPHIARTVGGSGHARLLPLSALLGAMALLTADVLGRVADYPDEIGAGVMAGLIGAPFFVALVRGGRIAGI